MNPKVIDISRYQQFPADGFARAHAFGIRGCVHKATEATGGVETLYAPRRVAAKAAGLLWGAYHFIRPVSVAA